MLAQINSLSYQEPVQGNRQTRPEGIVQTKEGVIRGCYNIYNILIEYYQISSFIYGEILGFIQESIEKYITLFIYLYCFKLYIFIN